MSFGRRSLLPCLIVAPLVACGTGSLDRFTPPEVDARSRAYLDLLYKRWRIEPAAPSLDDSVAPAQLPAS